MFANTSLLCFLPHVFFFLQFDSFARIQWEVLEHSKEHIFDALLSGIGGFDGVSDVSMDGRRDGGTNGDGGAGGNGGVVTIEGQSHLLL